MHFTCQHVCGLATCCQAGVQINNVDVKLRPSSIESVLVLLIDGPLTAEEEDVTAAIAAIVHTK